MLGKLERPADKDYISNSWLSKIKRELLGQPHFFGGEAFLEMGKELHKRFLEPDRAWELMKEDDKEERLTGMVQALWDNPLLKEAWKRSEKEVEYVKDIMGVRFLGVLDMKYKRIGIDLKTTWTKTRVSFIEAAKRYDYFRQATVYMQLADLDSFVFVSVSKEPPHKVFELHCNDYPEEMKCANAELEFLVKIHKQFYSNETATARSI